MNIQPASEVKMAATHRTAVVFHKRCRIAAALCAVAMLTACTTPPGSAPTTSRQQEDVSELKPSEALGTQAQGRKVRWSGGVNSISPEGDGRQCFRMLVANFSPGGNLDWPREPSYFYACGRGTYDPQLVAQFSLLTIEGRVDGQKLAWGTLLPVLEIERLYRHTDCVQGEEEAPGCYAGYLMPR